MVMLLQVDGALADLEEAQLGDSVLEEVSWAWLQIID